MNVISGHFQGRDFWDGAVSMTASAQQFHTITGITSPYAACPIELTVFVSSHDNEATIKQTLEAIIEAMEVVGKTFEVLVIDDGSRDRSVELIREFMEEHDNINIVLRINKSGKGLAQNYVDGAFMGCGTYYRMVFGNNSEPVETMVDVFKSVGDADIIVPYYISRLRQNRLQWFLLRLCNVTVNVLSGNRINCYTAPHIHLRYNVMRWHSDILGSSFQMDLLCQLLAHDFTYKQVPCRAVSKDRFGPGAGLMSSLSFTHAILNIMLRRISRSINGQS